MSKTLYEINEEFLAIDNLLIESGGEITPKIEELLNLADLEIQTKADGYYKYIKSLEALAKAIDDEKKRLDQRKKTTENRIKMLKERIKYAMELRCIETLEAGVNNFKIQNNGGKRRLEILSESEIPNEYKNTLTVIEIDKEKLYKELQDDKLKISGALLHEQGKSLRLK